MNKNIIIGFLVVILLGGLIYAGTSLTTEKIISLEDDYAKIDNAKILNEGCSESSCWIYPDVSQDKMIKDMFEIIKIQQQEIELLKTAVCKLDPLAEVCK